MSLMDKYRSKESTPVRREHRFGWSGTTEVTYNCSKCMAVMVDMKCIHCTGKTLTPEEEARMSAEMDAMVKEYNELTGKTIKRFASIAIGQQRLEQARFRKANPDMKPPKKEKAKKVAKPANNVKMSDAVRNSWDDEDVAHRRGQRHEVTVEGKTYGSASKAFKGLGIQPKGLIAFRLKLKKEGKATYEHNGKAYHFTAKLREKEEATA